VSTKTKTKTGEKEADFMLPAAAVLRDESELKKLLLRAKKRGGAE
jgi:hypothetical protein